VTARHTPVPEVLAVAMVSGSVFFNIHRQKPVPDVLTVATESGSVFFVMATDIHLSQEC
jgi:hypothetical protein